MTDMALWFERQVPPRKGMENTSVLDVGTSPHDDASEVTAKAG